MRRRASWSRSLLVLALFAAACLARPVQAASATSTPPPLTVWSAADSDKDGIPDAVEASMGTDPKKTDTDGDGFYDMLELINEYDPRSASTTRLARVIEIDLKRQRLTFRLSDMIVAIFPVSTGKRSTPTPTGTFTIAAKAPRAWSRRAGLWMPWWMNFRGKGAPGGLYALHELPIWPSGRREGASHLGVPVSGGCVRLGIGPEKFLYDITPLGTKVVIVAG